MAIGVEIDFVAVLERLQPIDLSRGMGESESQWVKRLTGVVRTVLEEAHFLSPDEWRRSDSSAATWVEGMGQGGPLPLPKYVDGDGIEREGWQLEAPKDDVIREWIMALAPTNLGVGRHRLLAAHIVGWRWRLSADAVLSKRLAQRRTNW